MPRFLSALWLLITPWIAMAGDITVPFETCERRNAILVTVSLNGRGRLFIVDTGAERTIVDPAALGLSRLDMMQSRFRSMGAGFSGQATWGVAEMMRIGSLQWRERPVVVMDLKEVREVYGRPIEGLLGQDVLREFDRVTFDFRSRHLVLSR